MDKIFYKKENAGFIGVRLLVRIPSFETLFENGLIEKSLSENEEKCFLCKDSSCTEYANIEEVDSNGNHLGWVFHVSQCQLEPYEGETK